MIPIANPELGLEEKERVENVIKSGQLADGPEVRNFESEFANFCNVDHGIATANGTTALHAAFEALDIGDGDQVVTTPFSFVASANAIRLSGAEPVFADINEETYNLDPDAVEDIVHNRDIDAILAVHLYGYPADMRRFEEIASDNDLVLIEDAAQAHGAKFDGRPVGSFGDAACFSFYPTKNMTTGEGGMITTDRDDVADLAASYVNHGRDVSNSYDHVRLGHNFRMTSIAAAIGRAQLEKLPDYVEKRRENASRLTEGLAETDVTLPTERRNSRHAYHQYTVRSTARDRLIDHLEDRGIGAGVYYPTPIHEQPAYDVDHSAPVAEQAANEVLSLPVHPQLSESDIEDIVAAIAGFEGEL